MAKLVAFIKRRADMERQDFLAYWRGKHVPLVEQLPGLRRQCSNLAVTIPGRDPRFDLVLEAWWDNPAEIVAALDSSHGDAVQKSLAGIADPGQVVSAIVAERVVIPPPEGHSFLKTFVIIQRRPDLSFEEFDRHWAVQHASIARRLPGMRGYVQCSALQLPGHEPGFDGCPVGWFDDLEANRAAVHSSVWAELRADEPNFVIQEQLIGLATYEDS